MFDQDYYYPKQKKTLCMRCASPIKKGEKVERRIKWDVNGNTAGGVLILCPSCEGAKVDKSEYPKIKKQILNATRTQAEYAGVSKEKIETAINLMSKMELREA